MVLLKKMAAAGGLVFFLILCSCGEFDSVLPINQTYQVSAFAGDHSLDEYSGIKLHDEIQPFFVHPINGDQDIRGLMVFLQTLEGKPAGEKIRYVIGEPEEEEEEEEEEKEEGEEDRVLILAAGTGGKLPSFQMGEDLEIGPYRMVFQVLGEKGRIFSKTEKAVYYLGGADYSISEISAYLPGYSPGSYLIAPGTVIMLEARVTADEGLDPYVVWYDGKKQIGEGKISAGGSKLFFKVPDENSFRLLRAEAFPFPPDKRSGARDSESGERLRGKIRELSLPVSSKGKELEYFLTPEKERKNFRGYYLFAGNLLDSLDSHPRRVLVKEDDAGEGLSWLGYGGVYGLAVGPRDYYLIPKEIFGPSLQDQEKKVFSFRCKLLGDGPVFSASLANGSAGVQLSTEKGNLVLTLTAGGYSKKVETVLPPTEDFIAFTLSLDFRENTLTAVLSPEWMPDTETSLDLAGFPAGAVVYRLGTPVSGKTQEEKPLEEEEGPSGLPVLILDELAVTAKEE
jgi:hypothetical protein